MPCVNCRRIYNETGIKTPHWWFGNRGTCCFPGGTRDQMLGRCVRIIPDGILSNIFQGDELIGCAEITREWSSMSLEQRKCLLRTLIKIWATRIKDRIDGRYNSSNVVTPGQHNPPHVLAYLVASRMAREENNHEVLDTYDASVRIQIFDYFRRAQTDTSADNILRTRLQREANRLRRENNQIRRETNILQARERASQVAMRPSTKLFAAPTPSTTVHESDDCPVCLNEFKSACGTTVTSCGHKICIACFANIVVKAAAQKKVDCPICRTTVLS